MVALMIPSSSRFLCRWWKEERRPNGGDRGGRAQDWFSRQLPRVLQKLPALSLQKWWWAEELCCRSYQVASGDLHGMPAVWFTAQLMILFMPHRGLMLSTWCWVAIPWLETIVACFLYQYHVGWILSQPPQHRGKLLLYCMLQAMMKLLLDSTGDACFQTANSYWRRLLYSDNCTNVA